MNYCNLKINLKCDYATRILKALKEKGIKVEDDTYQKVARMIFKNQGVKINLGVTQDDESRNNNYNNSYQNHTSYKNYNSFDANKRDGNKDELKWQRKNNK